MHLVIPQNSTRLLYTFKTQKKYTKIISLIKSQQPDNWVPRGINLICKQSGGLRCPVQCFEWQWAVIFAKGWGLARGCRHPPKQKHGTFTALARAPGGADMHRKQHRPVIDPGSNWPPSTNWLVVAAESRARGGQDRMDAVGGKIASEHFRGSSAGITPSISDWV